MSGKRLIIWLFIIWIFPSVSFSKKPDKKFFRKANKFFRKHVHHGMVDYCRLRKDPEQLKRLLTMIGNISTQDFTPKVQRAYYINVYNILLIQTVLEYYPVLYPVEHIGLFSIAGHKVGNDTLTLNELERRKIIAQFKDIRILFMMSAGTQGYPPLPSYAYKPRKFDKQLRKRMEEICNSYDYVRVFKKSSLILLAENFRSSPGDLNKDEIIKYINEYREEPLPAGYKIDFYPVNRKCNIEELCLLRGTAD